MSLFTEDYDEAQISKLLKADKLMKEADENLDKYQLEKLLHTRGAFEMNKQNDQVVFFFLLFFFENDQKKFILLRRKPKKKELAFFFKEAMLFLISQ